MEWAGRKALVTGGAGFIGSHLADALSSAGARVRILDNFSTGLTENVEGIGKELDVHEGDVRSERTCRRACRGIDTVFHLAAFVSVPGSMADPRASESVNAIGTLNMFLAARECGVRRFVFSSSSAVYGDTDSGQACESMTLRAKSPYGLHKVVAESLVRLFAENSGMDSVSLRYFNVYGPRQRPASEYAAVVPRFLHTVLAGGQPVIFGDGDQTRDFVYVADVVRANMLAANAQGLRGEAVNIASGRAVTLNELCAAISRVTGRAISPAYAEERPGDVRHSRAATELASKLLGFVAEYDLDTGLAEMAARLRGPNRVVV